MRLQGADLRECNGIESANQLLYSRVSERFSKNLHFKLIAQGFEVHSMV
jgi:hypothetical protein